MKTLFAKILLAGITATLAIPGYGQAVPKSLNTAEAAIIQKLKKNYTMDDLRDELRIRAINLVNTIPALEKTALQRASTSTVYTVYIDRQKAIYGTDNRVEARSSPPPMFQNINKVAGFFRRDNVIFNSDGSVSLKDYQSFKERYSLCPAEKFQDQPSIAYCTGFAVAKNIIASAGHCIVADSETPDQQSLQDFVVIFGFYQTNGKPTLRFEASDVYYPVKAVKKLETNVVKGQDYLLLKVDHDIPQERIVRLSEQPVKDKQNVYVIGHPCGLPMKCAGGAYVRNNSYPNCFVSNLDTYGGNSGSPVFNADNNKVEGILVRGNEDFVLEGPCQRSTICKDNGCDGEDVTRTSVFLSALKNFQE